MFFFSINFKVKYYVVECRKRGIRVNLKLILWFFVQVCTCVGCCRGWLPTYDRQRPSRQTTGPNQMINETNQNQATQPLFASYKIC